MDWIGRINGVIDYIESNLDGEIDYREIAAIACCSADNFQRMFSYIADKALSEYIRERRLTRAAYDVVSGEARVLDIAVRYGYDSADAFSRAFQRFHGVLPSKARAETVMLRSCPRLSFHITIKGAMDMNYQIEKRPAFNVTGYSTLLETKKVFDIVPGLWKKAWDDGRMNRLFEMLGQNPGQRPAGIIGVAAGGEWGESQEMTYTIGVTTAVGAQQDDSAPQGMVTMHLPEAVWVIINADGELPAAVQRIHKQFYSEWLPGAGYELDDLPALECYMGDDKQEVWIAVRKPQA